MLQHSHYRRRNNRSCCSPNASIKQIGHQHSCGYIRSGYTDQFKDIVKEWIENDFVREWKGQFISAIPDTGNNTSIDFFGLPSSPPFYVGKDGMQSISKGILDDLAATTPTKLGVYTGTRVAQMEQNKSAKRWNLFGTSGMAAYHDTPERIAKQNPQDKQVLLGEFAEGYDAVILTDVSSSFGKWHRASAGVPESFATKVRERVGSRVPLFTAMIAFEKQSNIPFDAATFDNDIVWFAAKSNSKPGMDNTDDDKKMAAECWTIVSTPEYAMKKIEETPMQDPKTGEFIPQSKEYLSTVPGPELTHAFCNDIKSIDGILKEGALSEVPRVIYTDAQRWGSALPSHRHLNENSTTRKVIAGVPYDSGRAPLAPTSKQRRSNEHDNDRQLRSFLVDDELMLLQAGDMVSSYTPGLEGAALSGVDAAEYLLNKLLP